MEEHTRVVSVTHLSFYVAVAFDAPISCTGQFSTPDQGLENESLQQVWDVRLMSSMYN
jgi:hypothetical protein